MVRQKQEQQKQTLKFIKKNKLFYDVCSNHQVVSSLGKLLHFVVKTLEASFIRSFLCKYGCLYGCLLEQADFELFICIFCQVGSISRERQAVRQFQYSLFRLVECDFNTVM